MPASSTPMSANLYAAVVHVRNLEKAAEFYQTVLGLRPGLREADALLLEDGTGERPLALRRRPGVGRQAGGLGVQTLVWTLPNVAELERRHESMEAAGVNVYRHDATGAPTLVVNDPEGHRLVLVAADREEPLSAIPIDVYTYDD